MPAETQPTTPPEARLKRREALLKGLITTGVTLFVWSGIETTIGVVNLVLADKETKSELQARGVTNPAPENLEIARHIPHESPTYAPLYRRDDALTTAANTVAENDHYNQEYSTTFKQKVGKDAIPLLAAKVVGTAVGFGITHGGAAQIAVERKLTRRELFSRADGRS